MTLTVEFAFPLGRYHATPWDRHVNEGVVEWPPTPWRLTRALFAVWRERCPELDEANVMAALDVVAGPPTYVIPRWRAAATRHYYPANDHRPPASVSTDKIVDAFVAIDPSSRLAMTWDAEISAEAADVLGQLVAALPYLGRADSVCEATLTVGFEAPDTIGTRHDPHESGDHPVAVPVRPLDPDQLTVTTDAMRRARFRRPPGMAEVAYDPPVEEGAGMDEQPQGPRPAHGNVSCAVLSVRGRPTPSHVLLVAVADLLFDAVQEGYTRLTGQDAPPVLTGHPPGASAPLQDQHRHAHVWPLAEPKSGRIDRVVVWAPGGFTAAEVAAVGSVRALRLSRRAAEGERDDFGRPVIRGLMPARVLLTGLGAVEDHAPELGATSARWTSLSPFVPSHHQKDRRFDGDRIGPFFKAFLIAEIERELHHRGHEVTVTDLRARPLGQGEAAAQRYRRYRLGQRLADARPGVWLEVELGADVAGPLALGALSHFGLGLFGAA